ncbi:MAG: DUF3795 domain-containing protein [Anaerolineae bacterium]
MCGCCDQEIACCGLVCNECSIYLLPTDRSVQDKMIPWFKAQGWLKAEEGLAEVVERKMYCKGCHTDRTDVHWSADCAILTCCVDEHKLENCSQCDAFVCERLTTWAGTDARYNRALERLRGLRVDIQGM